MKAQLRTSPWLPQAAAFVAKWPYVTAFYCSIHVKGTGSLGGVKLVRARSKLTAC